MPHSLTWNGLAAFWTARRFPMCPGKGSERSRRKAGREAGRTRAAADVEEAKASGRVRGKSVWGSSAACRSACSAGGSVPPFLGLLGGGSRIEAALAASNPCGRGGLPARGWWCFQMSVLGPLWF